MTTKDPYLSELDALDEGELAPPEEEPTDVRIENPPVVPPSPPPVKNPASEPMAIAKDIPVQVVVVLGKKEVSVKDLLELKAGEIVELNRLPNESVDLVTQGKVIAKGELVEIEGKLGVRVLKILK